MIFLILIQVFTIDTAVEAYTSGDPESAYSIVFSMDDTTGFYGDELTEYRAFFSMHTGRLEQADSLYQRVLDSKYDSIRHKAYTNYAELQHRLFNFDKRLRYLQKAYDIKPTPQLIRIIARHHFQIRADYEIAREWIGRHYIETPKDKAGFHLLQAEYAESIRQYEQAIDYYNKAKISAKEANLFNYELFSAEGVYRSQRLYDLQREEKMINWIVYFILSLGLYYYIKRNCHVGNNQYEDTSRNCHR